MIHLFIKYTKHVNEKGLVYIMMYSHQNSKYKNGIFKLKKHVDSFCFFISIIKTFPVQLYYEIKLHNFILQDKYIGTDFGVLRARHMRLL